MTEPDRKAPVGIVMGSDSDLEIMRRCSAQLAELGIGSELRVISAHRTPDEAAAFARGAERSGLRVIIAAAGGAAHLAGALASHVTLPVIGVPLEGFSCLGGLDALLSTVQMPAGVPVATVAIGKAGAANAGVLAAQMLALSHPEIARKLKAHKEKLARGVEEKSRKLKGGH